MKFVGTLCVIVFLVHFSTTQGNETTESTAGNEDGSTESGTVVEGIDSSANTTDVEIDSSSPDPSSNDSLTTEGSLEDAESTVTSSTDETSPTTTVPNNRSPTGVNVLFTYEKEEMEKLIDFGLNYLKDTADFNTSGYTIESSRKLYMKDREPTKIIVDLCQEIDEFEPDIVVDFTERGVPSEAIKIVTKTLQLPTVSTSNGRQREWMNLNESQYKYLLHVQSPADTAIQVIRTLSKTLNITNMAILHNKDYEMFYNYRDLLQDTPTRHRIIKLAEDDPQKEQLKQQLKEIQLARFTTVFVAGSVAEIQTVLKIASHLDREEAESIRQEKARAREKRAKRREERKKQRAKQLEEDKNKANEAGDEEATTAAPPPEDEEEEEEEVEENLDESKNVKQPLLHPTSSWYSLTLEPRLPTCTDCPMDVSLVHLKPILSPTDEINWETAGLEGKLEERFKIDLLVNTIHTAGKMKVNKTWPMNKTIPCAKYQYDTKTLDSGLDFAKHLNNSIISQLSLYPIIVSKTGDHFIGLNLSLVHLNFKYEAKKYFESELGTWKAGENRIHTFDFQGNQTLDFHKAQVMYRVVTVVQPPFIYKRKKCDGYKHCYYGYSIDVLDELQKTLKFNYTIYDVDMYGHMNDSGLNEWTGMVYKLKYKEADMAIGAFSVMPEREKVMDFTDPVYDLVGFQVLMRKQPLQTSLFKFLTVLENDVWMCILGAYFFTSILMWIFDRWSPYSFQNNKEKFEDDEEKREFTLRESLWFCITSLTPQGGGEAPKNLSGRLVAATWWLFGFIIIASYTANLAAFLTVSRLEAPVESLQDLSRQYKVMYAPIFQSSAYFYFDRMAHIEHKFYEAWKDLSLNDSLSEFERSGLAVWEYPVSDWYTKLWQSLVENFPPTNYSEAVHRTMGKDSPVMLERVGGEQKLVHEFAWIGESTEIRYEAMTHCMFRVVGKEFSMRPYAIGVQKGSPLKAQLNEEIRKLEHSRFFEQRKYRWWEQNENEATCRKYDNLADGISLSNLGGVFIVLILGFTMTFISTVLELWWHHRKNNTHDLSGFNSEAPSREWSAAFATVERTDFHAQYSRPPSKTSNW